MSNVEIKPGITVDCRGLSDGEKEAVALILDGVVEQLGGCSYARPIHRFLIIDGEEDSNSVECVHKEQTIEFFMEHYPNYHGATPYAVEASALLAEE